MKSTSGENPWAHICSTAGLDRSVAAAITAAAIRAYHEEVMGPSTKAVDVQFNARSKPSICRFPCQDRHGPDPFNTMQWRLVPVRF